MLCKHSSYRVWNGINRNIRDNRLYYVHKRVVYGRYLKAGTVVNCIPLQYFVNDIPLEVSLYCNGKVYQYKLLLLLNNTKIGS